MGAAEVGLCGRFHWEGHRFAVDKAALFADAHSDFQFLPAESLVLPARSNSGRAFAGQLHGEVLRSILLEPPQWHQTMSSVENSGTSIFVNFGLERSMPPSLMRKLSARLVHMADLERQTQSVGGTSIRLYADTDIAIVGMACKVAGADDVNEFWQLLCEGKSQHQEVPADRFPFKSAYRSEESSGARKWFGNFMNDHDAFDHKFFKKTPREAASMDPQQRQVLQIAYQAVEQSGYFQKANPDTHVGCYIGVCAVDYENNVACHPANAFTATGTLRGFIAGKVSHFFGWTGPGLTLDSACSSSLVSLHLACQAILNGECNAAVAGGSHVMTSPLCYQNLAGASFLSKTGQCKPFDIAADGYCRGEGCAVVFLKKLSTAIADNDQVLGVIAGTAVRQNENCTPIVVPNAPSLTDIFKVVLKKSKLAPEQVGVVEAHGTGTAVGDPAEYDSIRRVLGGGATRRTSQLLLSSVKGLIGHLECTSGMASLVKTVLMIQNSAVPPQASFNTLNPAVKAEEEDRITVPTSLTQWNSGYRAALINNYGASGSNASMVVVEAPRGSHPWASSRKVAELEVAKQSKLPFSICAMDDKGIGAYASVLNAFLSRHPDTALSDLSFNVARQSNRTLPRRQLFTCRSMGEFKEQLSALENDQPVQQSSPRPVHNATPPVILAFGGQISTFVGLDRRVYETVGILQGQLDLCDGLCRSLDLPSIFPAVFQREPIDDPVQLQTALFAIQYSSAKCWIKAGVKPVAVLGHSFGELTALCVAGILSLKDAIKIIATRAKAIRDEWGADKGMMMALEASLQDVERLVEVSNAALKEGQEPVVIACFNGPRSYTLAGSAAAIDAVVDVLSRDNLFAVKWKKLNVTNAFHSTLVEPLMISLRESAADLIFEQPSIEWARCTETYSGPDITKNFFADHMREPVYFNHCVQRLSARYPEAVWLEGGSNSTVTSMISRALGAPQNNTFVPVNISSDTACDNLADTTVKLWAAGVDVTHWPHSGTQSSQYNVLLLPPYQFAKSKHWIELKDGQELSVATREKPTLLLPAVQAENMPETLLTFVGFQDASAKRHARFRVNTMIPQFANLMKGHTIAHTTPICPATVQIDLAIDALSQISSIGKEDFNPEIYDVENLSPICSNPSLHVSLDLEASASQPGAWLFKFSSAVSPSSSTTTTHTSGRIVPSAKALSTELDLSRYQRVISHRRCQDLLDATDSEDVIQGRSIYRVFADVVDYGEQYRGLVKLVGKGNMSAGSVVKHFTGKTWFDAHLSDAFCQVGGIFVNCMTNRDASEIFIARGLERWIRSCQLAESRPSSYDVLAFHNGSTTDGAFLTDIFVFRPDTGTLVEAILGIHYVRVPKLSISKLLTRLTNTSAPVAAPSTAAVVELSPAMDSGRTPVLQTIKDSTVGSTKQKKTQAAIGVSDKKEVVFAKLKAVLCDLAGIDEGEIKVDSNLADLGVDSLMGMELMNELESKFKCTFPPDEAAEITTMKELIECTRKATGVIAEIDVANICYDSASATESSLTTTRPASVAESVTSAEDTGSPIPSGSSAKVDVFGMLAELIGIDQSELLPTSVLGELGVDSLMAMELRAGLESEFGIELDETLAVETMTAATLNKVVNGTHHSAPEAHVQEAHAPIPNKATIPIQPDHPLELSLETITEAFHEVKVKTDLGIMNGGTEGYIAHVLPIQDELCVTLTLEAFEKLGCRLNQLRPGDRIRLPDCVPAHKQLLRYLCGMVESVSGLLKAGDDGFLTRTDKEYSLRSSQAILQELQSTAPNEASANDMTYYAGSHLADVLAGNTDGIKLIFGSEKGRRLVSNVYGDWPLNRILYGQIELLLSALLDRIPLQTQAPLKILEMGAGTGGTTKWLVPLLARLGRPVEYTFTDLSPAFVAAARKRFSDYPFMKFRTHDIEKEPAVDLIGTQHIVLASNAVHATSSMVSSTANIRKALRPNGVLMMVEMTRTLYWVDMIFGLFEGWWRFDDGRTHAVASETQWRRALETAGYGHVEWTDGVLPESKAERLLMAVSCEKKSKRDLVSSPQEIENRRVIVDRFVNEMSRDFDVATQCPQSTTKDGPYVETRCGTSVLVTGGTGSLGSHLVAHLAQRPGVDTVVVLNRRHEADAMSRQLQAFSTRGLSLSAAALDKLQVYGTDMTKPQLGLPRETYTAICSTTNHIIHVAWAMSAKRPVSGFQSQFHVMRNMIELARDAAATLPLPTTPVRFEFVSSIAVVGHYPLRHCSPDVPEERVDIEDVLPNGYGDAKFACERALDLTLHRHPERFAASCVRIGQIAGATASGYWNTQEHLPFLLRSAQTLRCLPKLDGLLSWTPVDCVAGALADLVLAPGRPSLVYNIDNPVRQRWSDVLPVLADAMGLDEMVPFQEWVDRVRAAPTTGGPAGGNPASLLVDFLDDNFERMSCGGLLLSTAQATKHSPTLAAAGPVSNELVRRYVQYWKNCGFLT